MSDREDREKVLREMLLDLIGPAADEHDLKMVRKILAFEAAVGWESEQCQVEFYKLRQRIREYAERTPCSECAAKLLALLDGEVTKSTK